MRQKERFVLHRSNFFLENYVDCGGVGIRVTQQYGTVTDGSEIYGYISTEGKENY